MAETEHIAQKFIEALPHGRELKLKVIEVGEGSAAICMPYDKKLVGDPKTGVIHGGAVSTVIDTCCGSAVMSHPKARGVTATIDLRIDYMRAATPGQAIVARATCYHMARNVAFVRATAYDNDPDLPVATASGSFTVGEG